MPSGTSHHRALFIHAHLSPFYVTINTDNQNMWCDWGSDDERVPVIIESTTWFLHIDEFVPEGFLDVIQLHNNCTQCDWCWSASAVDRSREKALALKSDSTCMPASASMLLYKLLFLLPSTQIASDSFSLHLRLRLRLPLRHAKSVHQRNLLTK